MTRSDQATCHSERFSGCFRTLPSGWSPDVDQRLGGFRSGQSAVPCLVVLGWNSRVGRSQKCSCPRRTCWHFPILRTSSMESASSGTRVEILSDGFCRSVPITLQWAQHGFGFIWMEYQGGEPEFDHPPVARDDRRICSLPCPPHGFPRMAPPFTRDLDFGCRSVPAAETHELSTHVANHEPPR